MKGIKESLAKVLFTAAAGVSILAVALICVFLFASGVPAIGKIGVVEFLTGTVWRPASETFGILPMILGSIYATLGALVIGVPTGLFCAVYLSRFASPRVKRIVTPGVELLAGIPSVIYGFFGLVVLVPLIRQLFHVQGMSLLAASIILGVMILPTIITVARNALDAVPDSYYEGALALGADHERSVFRVLVPAAGSGIMAGIVLGIGRAIGETMAVVIDRRQSASRFPAAFLKACARSRPTSSWKWAMRPTCTARRSSQPLWSCSCSCSSSIWLLPL